MDDVTSARRIWPRDGKCAKSAAPTAHEVPWYAAEQNRRVISTVAELAEIGRLRPRFGSWV
jgi:hypothetical protein